MLSLLLLLLLLLLVVLDRCVAERLAVCVVAAVPLQLYQLT